MTVKEDAQAFADKRGAMTLERLLTAVEEVARAAHDGHVTIMRFTGGWKVVFGTPYLSPPGDGYDYVLREVAARDSLEQALTDALARAHTRWLI